MRRILSFIVFSFMYLKLSRCEKFLNFLLSERNCSEMPLKAIIPLKTGCYETVFNNFMKLSYNPLLGRINFTLYDDYTCSVKDYASAMIPMNMCVELFYSNISYFMNLTAIDEFPIREDDIFEGWVVQEEYKTMNEDGLCENPVGPMSGDHDSVGFEFLAQKSASNTRFMTFCTNDDIVIYFDAITTGSTFVLPRKVFEGRCRRLIKNSQFYRIDKCITDEELFSEDFVGEIPSISSHEYIHDEYSFNPNCTNFYGKRPVRLDRCDPVRSQVWKSTSSRFMIINYHDRVTCEGGIESITVWKPDLLKKENTIFEKCVGHGSVKLGDNNVGAYRKLSLSNDPYSPSQMSNFWSSREEFACGNDIPLQFLKDPSLLSTAYLDEEYCGKTVPGTSVTFYFEHLPFNGLSFKGVCDNGELVLKVWTSTDDCLGDYKVVRYDHSESLCISSYIGEDLVFDRLMCIPRYCGDVSQYEKEVVCSGGRGKCVSKDLCDCDSGFFGNLCQEWLCFQFKFDDPEACSGNGVCASPNSCVCDTGYSGEKCEGNDFLQILRIFLPIIAGFLCICCVCCGSCILLCVLFCLCDWSFFVLTILMTSGISVWQKKRISKFEELDDFEVLLQEQLLEKDTTVAHLKINQKLFEIDYDEVKVDRMIGKGGSDATIFLAKWKGVACAFKCFKTRTICSSQEKYDQFQAEVNMIITINHAHVIRFYGATLKPPRVGIVMEYCGNGEILEFLVGFRNKRKEENAEKCNYPMSEKLRMLREIISAMEYIHSRNIIHRDIKSENILIDSHQQCKLLDFGLSRIIKNAERRPSAKQQHMTNRVGTSIYMAPEMLKGLYDQSCDIFSFSVLVWVVLCENANPYDDGKHDFGYNVELKVASDPLFRPSLTDDKIYEMNNIVVEDQQENKYGWMKEMMAKCWDVDPLKRLSFSQLSVLFDEKKESKK